MITCTLRQDDPPVWTKSIFSTLSSGVIVLCGEDYCQVEVPSLALLSASPLVRSILSDHLPPLACSPAHLTLPAATQEVLEVVRDILIIGTVAGLGGGRVENVRQILEVLMIDTSLLCCQSQSIDISGFFGREETVECEESDRIMFGATSDHSEATVVSKGQEGNRYCDEERADDVVTSGKSMTNVKVDIIALDEHLVQEHYKKCFKCGKTFFAKAGLRKHIESVHMQIAYCCNLCDMKFTQPSSLGEHMRVNHTGDEVVVKKGRGRPAGKEKKTPKAQYVPTGKSMGRPPAENPKPAHVPTGKPRGR